MRLLHPSAILAAALLLGAAAPSPGAARAKTCDLDDMLRGQGGTSSLSRILLACQKGDDLRIPLMLIHTIEQVCDFDKPVAIDSSDHVSCILGEQSAPSRHAAPSAKRQQASR